MSEGTNYVREVGSEMIVSALRVWAARDGGGVVTDPCSGFVLPSGVRRSPDAAWNSRSKLAKLMPYELDRFWRLCPEFVIELGSPHDRLRKIRAKMEEWIAAGADCTSRRLRRS